MVIFVTMNGGKQLYTYMCISVCKYQALLSSFDLDIFIVTNTMRTGLNDFDVYVQFFYSSVGKLISQ